MQTGYPTASAESGQKSLLRRAQKATAATGCPLDFQQTAQFQFLPEGGAHQGKEPGETMAVKALLCAENGVKPSLNESGGKPILPEPQSVKNNSYQSKINGDF